MRQTYYMDNLDANDCACKNETSGVSHRKHASPYRLRYSCRAPQKGPMALVIQIIGLARARVKIGLANLVYNMRRFVWLNSTAAGT